MKTTENEIAEAVMRACASKQSGTVSMAEARSHIDKHVNLTSADRQASTTRSGEEMWEQQVRNIQSHHATDGNYIKEGYLEHVEGGYRLTSKGYKHLGLKIP